MCRRSKLLAAAAFLLFGATSILSGCGTTKGLGTGIGAMAVGITEDAKGFWEGLVKANAWIKEHAW